MIRLVEGELLKLRTTRLWWGLLLGIVLLSLALGILQAVIAGLDTDGDGTGAPLLDDPATLRGAYTAGLSVAYLFTLSLGVIAMAGEYRHQTMSATVLAVPVRVKIVLGKLFALVVAGLGYGVATVLAGVAGAAVVFAVRGADLWRSDAGLPRTLTLAVVAVALWALIGLGVGTLIRNQVVALLLAVGIAWIVEPLLGLALQALDYGSVAKFFPTAATGAIVQPGQVQGGPELDYLPWWGGILVLLGYAAVSAGIGTVLTLRRDIT
jgi:ABC-type transport system involved in multi-copper enzyme maturation permease subunit